LGLKLDPDLVVVSWGPSWILGDPDWINKVDFILLIN
jgi:hypothetical protein